MEIYKKELLRRFNHQNKKSELKYSTICSFMIRSNKIDQLISDIYVENRFRIQLSFYEFRELILGLNKTNRYIKYKKEKSSFRQKKIKKKELSEKNILKKEWRKKVKYKDDRSKKNHFDYSDYFREYNYRSLRRWHKVRISQGDFDLQKKWKKYKHFNTEWLW